MGGIKIAALGGVRENAKNLCMVEVNDSIFILDVGLKYPENEQLGVDEVTPNIDYLVESKKRVQGIFLAYRYADAIGALPYILSEFKASVFGLLLTIELARLFAKKDNNVRKFNNSHVIDAETEIEFADATISLFKVTHSVPESLGIVVGTDEENIVYTGDFKFDQATRKYYRTDLSRLTEIGREGVLALLSDSANATDNVLTASGSKVAAEMDSTIADAEGRVIIAAVASNSVRIQQVFDSAADYGRRVVLTGFDAESIVRIAIHMKRLRLADEKLIAEPRDMHKFEDHELIIPEAGRMEESVSGLQKMALGRHRYMQIKEGDFIHIATTPSFSKEATVAHVENSIYKAGGVARLVIQTMNVSDHANVRDLQLTINLLQPRYLFPVQGEYRNLATHAELTQEAGMYPENIYIVKHGDAMVLGKDGFNHEGSVPAGDAMIDGNTIDDAGNIVLRNRKALSEDGIFIVALTASRREKKIVSKAKIHTCGFVYVKKSRGILRESVELVNQTIEDYLAQDSFDWGELKGAVRDDVTKFLFDQTKRRPAILPIVMEVR